jgi:hypothetical protein
MTAIQLQDGADGTESRYVALLRSGRHAEAEAHLRRLLDLQPDSAEAHGNLGNLLTMTGRVQEAAEAYRTALALEPRMTRARFGLALALIELGRRDEPERLLLRALEEAPDLDDARDTLQMLQQPPSSSTWVEAAQRSERICIVCATRGAREAFFEKTALGQSLAPWRDDIRLQLMLFDRNSRPLGSVYNEAIERSRGHSVHLVFVHDDVYLTDFDWPDKIIEGLRHWQVLGLVGNRRRQTGQPHWCFVDVHRTRDRTVNLSGVVAHGRGAVLHYLRRFGPSGQRCVLLDGFMLAAHSEVLVDHGLRFDPQFAFHFYDVDFCRKAEALGLSMGTWPIQVVHGSAGSYGSDAWHAAYGLYLRKYGEPAATGLAVA